MKKLIFALSIVIISISAKGAFAQECPRCDAYVDRIAAQNSGIPYACLHYSNSPQCPYSNSNYLGSLEDKLGADEVKQYGDASQKTISFEIISGNTKRYVGGCTPSNNALSCTQGNSSDISAISQVKLKS